MDTHSQSHRQSRSSTAHGGRHPEQKDVTMEGANVKLLDDASIQTESGVIPEDFTSGVHTSTSRLALSPRDTWISDDEDDSESSHSDSSSSDSMATKQLDSSDSDSDSESDSVTMTQKSRCRRLMANAPAPRTLLKLLIVVGIIATIAVLFAKYKGALIELPYKWAQSKGALGGVYITAFLVLWIICGLPVTFMELLCGFMFGYGYGVLVALIGKQIGAMAGFALGRKLLLKRSARLRERYIILQAIDLALKESPQKMTWLIAVAYVPEAIKVYGLSLFETIGFWYFSLVMGVTGIPYSLVTVWIGSSSQNLLQVINNEGGGEGGAATNKGVSTTSLALLIAGVVCAIIVLILFARYGMKARRQIMARLQAEEDVTAELEDDIESGMKASASSGEKGSSGKDVDHLKAEHKGDCAVKGEYSASSFDSSVASEGIPSSTSCSSSSASVLKTESVVICSRKPERATAPSGTSLIEMPRSPRTDAHAVALVASEGGDTFKSALV